MTNSCLCKSKRCNLSNSISSAKNTTVSSHEDTTQAPFGVISLASPQGRLLVTATRMLIKHGCPSLIRVKGRESENHPRIKLRKCKKAGRQAWLHIVCRHADLCSFFFYFYFASFRCCIGFPLLSPPCLKRAHADFAKSDTEKYPDTSGASPRSISERCSIFWLVKEPNQLSEEPPPADRVLLGSEPATAGWRQDSGNSLSSAATIAISSRTIWSRQLRRRQQLVKRTWVGWELWRRTGQLTNSEQEPSSGSSTCSASIGWLRTLDDELVS